MKAIFSSLNLDEKPSGLSKAGLNKGSQPTVAVTQDSYNGRGHLQGVGRGSDHYDIGFDDGQGY